MRILSFLLSMALVFSSFTTSNASFDGTPLSAVLTSSGDTDGSGEVMLTLNQGQGTISFELLTENIDPATAAHIHMGAAGTNGPVVVDFNFSGTIGSGVIEVDPELIKAIRKNPAGFYVNVHNPMYPSGAIRGQLSK